jgi:hypothetical protein
LETGNVVVVGPRSIGKTWLADGLSNGNGAAAPRTILDHLWETLDAPAALLAALARTSGVAVFVTPYVLRVLSDDAKLSRLKPKLGAQSATIAQAFSSFHKAATTICLYYTDAQARDELTKVPTRNKASLGAAMDACRHMYAVPNAITGKPKRYQTFVPWALSKRNVEITQTFWKGLRVTLANARTHGLAKAIEEAGDETQKIAGGMLLRPVAESLPFIGRIVAVFWEARARRAEDATDWNNAPTELLETIGRLRDLTAPRLEELEEENGWEPGSLEQVIRSFDGMKDTPEKLEEITACLQRHEGRIYVLETAFQWMQKEMDAMRCPVAKWLGIQGVSFNGHLQIVEEKLEGQPAGRDRLAAFYKGENGPGDGWDLVRDNDSLHRDVESIIAQAVMDTLDEEGLRIVLVEGGVGSGKSHLLKQVARCLVNAQIPRVVHASRDDAVIWTGLRNIPKGHRVVVVVDELFRNQGAMDALKDMDRDADLTIVAGTQPGPCPTGLPVPNNQIVTKSIPDPTPTERRNFATALGLNATSMNPAQKNCVDHGDGMNMLLVMSVLAGGASVENRMKTFVDALHDPRIAPDAVLDGCTYVFLAYQYRLPVPLSLLGRFNPRLTKLHEEPACRGLIYKDNHDDSNALRASHSLYAKEAAKYGPEQPLLFIRLCTTFDASDKAEATFVARLAAAIVLAQSDWKEYLSETLLVSLHRQFLSGATVEALSSWLRVLHAARLIAQREEAESRLLVLRPTSEADVAAQATLWATRKDTIREFTVRAQWTLENPDAAASLWPRILVLLGYLRLPGLRPETPNLAATFLGRMRARTVSANEVSIFIKTLASWREPVPSRGECIAAVAEWMQQSPDDTMARTTWVSRVHELDPTLTEVVVDQTRAWLDSATVAETAPAKPVWQAFFGLLPEGRSYVWKETYVGRAVSLFGFKAFAPFVRDPALLRRELQDNTVPPGERWQVEGALAIAISDTHAKATSPDNRREADAIFKALTAPGTPSRDRSLWHHGMHRSYYPIPGRGDRPLSDAAEWEETWIAYCRADDAFSIFDDAIKTHPRHDRNYSGRGHAAWKMMKCLELLEPTPRTWMAAHIARRGFIRRRPNLAADAERDFRAAVGLANEGERRSAQQATLGRFLLRVGEFNDARKPECFQEAARLLGSAILYEKDLSKLAVLNADRAFALHECRHPDALQAMATTLGLLSRSGVEPLTGRVLARFERVRAALTTTPPSAAQPA